MTRRQKQVHDLIVAHWREHGRTPTYRYLRDTLGLGIGTVHMLVSRLKSAGMVRDGQWGIIPVLNRVWK